MPKTFPLLALLEHRLRIEEQRQQEVARAEADHARLLGRVRLAEAACAAIVADIASLQRKPTLDTAAVISAQQRLSRALLELEQAKVVAFSALATLNAARSAAVTASQERLAIEKLRDAFMTAQAEQRAHAEQELLDELGAIRWRAQQGA